MERLPSFVYWRLILPYIPCFSITPSLLEYHHHIRACLRILQHSILGLDRYQRYHIERQLRRSSPECSIFTWEDDHILCYIYEDEHIYLVLYPLHGHQHDPDYLLIWK